MDIVLSNNTNSATRSKRVMSCVQSFSVELTQYMSKNIQSQLEILTLALDQSDHLIFIMDEYAHLVFVNKNACQLLEYDIPELLSMSITDIAPNFEEEVLVQSLLVGYNLEDSTIDMYFRARNKKAFPVEVEVSKLRTTKSYFSIVAKNKSSVRNNYGFLSHDEPDFVATAECSPDIIARYDLNHRCVYINEACEKITGYPRFKMIEHFLGQIEFFTAEQIRLVKHNIRLVIKSGLPIEFDFIIRHVISGFPVHLQIIISPEINQENEVTGVMIVARNITDLKRNGEELITAKANEEECNNIKSHFLDSVSHEMRGSINTIIELSRLLKDEALLQEDRDEFLDLIDGSGKKIKHMGEAILNVLRIESGNLKLNIENCNVQTILKEQYIEITEKLRSKRDNKIGVRLDLEDKTRDLALSGDIKLIKQVLQILSTHVLEHTQEGEITLGAQTQKNGRFTFYVSNIGNKIQNGKQDSLFNFFAQSDHRETMVFNEFRLSLAQRIAGALDGDIITETDRNKTLIYFSLPVFML